MEKTFLERTVTEKYHSPAKAIKHMKQLEEFKKAPKKKPRS